MYRSKYLENDGGNIEGYEISSEDENYKNFLLNEIDTKIADKISEFIRNANYNNIAIIKNINVEEDYRGQGLGRELLENFIDGVDIAILISDKYEIQNDGFVLEKFYEGSDFEKVCDGSGGSLMIFPSDIAIEIKEELNKLKKKKILKP